MCDFLSQTEAMMKIVDEQESFGITVEIYHDDNGKVLVRIDTTGLDENERGPTNLRVVLNDAFEEPLWDN